MEKEWFVYKIFVSSTFRDMDQERDVIKFQVLNRLNDHYRSRKIQFQVIDLRIGINTEKLEEAQSEDFVLDSCLQNIDNARPFFIGLLGERYGWIPSAQRWEAVVNRLDKEKRVLLTESRERSVTELEILYGAIGDNGKYINHSLFFFRDPQSYDGVPYDLLPTYLDLDTEKRTKNLQLKIHIQEIARQFQANDICRDYHLTWNHEKALFEGLDAFAHLVYDSLCREIDKEIAERQPPQTWTEQECLNKDFLHMKNATNKVETSQLADILKTVAAGGQVVLTGAEGSGKSVLLSQVFQKLSASGGHRCLSAFVGMSPYSKTMHAIARGWIVELGGPELSEDVDEQQVKATLLSQIQKAQQHGQPVTVFMDGIENFAPLSTKDLYLTWLPDDMPFLATVSASQAEQVLAHHPQATLLSVHPLHDEEEDKIIRCSETFFNIGLPEKLHQWLCANTSRPASINLLITTIANFSVMDFRKMRSLDADTEMEKINRFIMDILSRAPLHDVGQTLLYAITKVADNLGCGDMLMRSLRYIAHAGGGLSEEDLERLLGKEWEALRFHSLMSIFSDYFYCEQDYNRWHFRNPHYAKAFRPDSEEAQRQIHTDIAQLLLAYDNSEKQKQEQLFYQLLMSGQAELARGLMTRIEAEYQLPRGGWYRHSMYYILSEDRLHEQIRLLCQGFTATERVGFAYYFKESLPRFIHSDIIVHMAEDSLNDIGYQALDIVNAYRLASLYGSLFQASRAPELLSSLGMDTDLLKAKAAYYLQRSIDGYSYCYQQQPDYEDTRNMLCCMVSDMLPVCAENNDLAGMERYMSMISQLN